MQMIPIELIQKYIDELSDTVKLSLSNGDEWEVHFKKAKKMACFHGGWESFMEDNSIAINYFLLFKYTTNSHFIVHVFDHTATEIDFPCNVGKLKEKSVILDGSEDRSEFSEHEIPNRKEMVEGKLVHQNPHFIVKLKKYHISSQVLYVTREFSAKLLPDNPKSVYLEDCNGKRWAVECSLRTRRVSYLAKGWRVFSQEKELGAEDACDFELINDSEADKPVLKVHIFNSSEDVLGIDQA